MSVLVCSDCHREYKHHDDDECCPRCALEHAKATYYAALMDIKERISANWGKPLDVVNKALKELGL